MKFNKLNSNMKEEDKDKEKKDNEIIESYKEILNRILIW